MAKDYKIKYKDPENDVPYIKYVHAINESTAKTMFEHSWMHIHGDNTDECPEIVEVKVLSGGHWEQREG